MSMWKNCFLVFAAKKGLQVSFSKTDFSSNIKISTFLKWGLDSKRSRVKKLCIIFLQNWKHFKFPDLFDTSNIFFCQSGKLCERIWSYHSKEGFLTLTANSVAVTDGVSSKNPLIPSLSRVIANIWCCLKSLFPQNFIDSKKHSSWN